MLLLITSCQCCFYRTRIPRTKCMCANDQCSITRCCDGSGSVCSTLCDNSFRLCLASSCKEFTHIYWSNDDITFDVGEDAIGFGGSNPYTFIQEGGWKVKPLMHIPISMFYQCIHVSSRMHNCISVLLTIITEVIIMCTWTCSELTLRPT